jgi:hypothetical protein
MLFSKGGPGASQTDAADRGLDGTNMPTVTGGGGGGGGAGLIRINGMVTAQPMLSTPAYSHPP